MSKYYLSCGTFNFRDPNGRGFTILLFDDESLDIQLISHNCPSLNAGSQYYDAYRGVLYITDEVDGHDGLKSGGGRLYAFRFNKDDGSVKELGHVSALMNKTCYVTLTCSGRYALVSNHAGSSSVTKVTRNPDGSYAPSIVCEDGGVTLISLKEDGTPDKAIDCIVYQAEISGSKIRIPHCHSINRTPDGSLFFTCDKGLDMIYSYKVDEDNGRFIPLAERKMEKGTAPRYTCFHPHINVMYENNETSNELFAFRYDSETGNLTEIDRQKLIDEPYEKMMPSDLCITPDGRYLYAAARDVKKIVFFSVSEDGCLTKSATYDTAEGNVRGMRISSDGRFLFTATPNDGMLNVYRIHDNGRLSYARAFPVDHIGNVTVID